MTNESDLVAALRRRDPEAFSLLFEAYSDKIFRLAIGILGDEDEAEVIVQESFLRLFDKLDQFEGRAKLSTWLYRVAYNASIDHLRKHRPAQPLVDDVGSDEQAPLMPATFIDWSQAPETLFASAEIVCEASLQGKVVCFFVHISKHQYFVGLGVLCDSWDKRVFLPIKLHDRSP